MKHGPRMMAERRGFEPPSQFYPTNRLAGGCLQPLGHLSKTVLAEGVGFEPTELSLSGFQDRRLKPLGHPSTCFRDLNLGWIAVRLNRGGDACSPAFSAYAWAAPASSGATDSLTQAFAEGRGPDPATINYATETNSAVILARQSGEEEADPLAE